MAVQQPDTPCNPPWNPPHNITHVAESRKNQKLDLCRTVDSYELSKEFPLPEGIDLVHYCKEKHYYSASWGMREKAEFIYKGGLYSV